MCVNSKIIRLPLEKPARSAPQHRIPYRSKRSQAQLVWPCSPAPHPVAHGQSFLRHSQPAFHPHPIPEWTAQKPAQIPPCLSAARGEL